MNEMVERVARAWRDTERQFFAGVFVPQDEPDVLLKPEPQDACHVRRHVQGHPIVWGPGTYQDALSWIRQQCASAAIAALREPTEAMIEASTFYEGAWERNGTSTWQAMIDAALK